MIEGIGGISSGFDGMAVGLGSLKTAIEQVIGLAANLDTQISGIFDSAAAAVGEGLMTGGKGVFNFAKDSVQTGMEFDTVLSSIAATMGKSRDEINKTVVQTEDFTGTLGKFAEKLGAETKFTTAQAAQGLLILAQAGLTAKEQIEALPPILSLASAGAIDLDTSATYVTAAVMGFRDSMENASYYADMISKGATLAKTDVNMLGAAFSGASATGATYNQTAKSTETALLRLANMNVVGMEAANAYNRVMMDLFTATGDGKKALDELGISMYDASTGEARDLNDIINELSAALSKYNDETRLAYESQIFSAWGMKAFDKMAATSTDTLVVFNTELSNVTGAASKQAGTQLESLSGKLAILNSAFEAVKIQISKMIMPEFGSFVEQLSTGLGKAAEQLSEGDFKGAFYALGNTIVDLINQGADDILNSSDEISAFIDGIILFANKVGSTLIERGAEILPVATDLLLQLVGGAVSGLADYIADEDNVEKIRVSLNLVIKKIDNFLHDHAQDFFVIVETLYDLALEFLPQVFKLKRETTAAVIATQIKKIFTTSWFEEDLKDGAKTGLGMRMGEGIAEGVSLSPIAGKNLFRKAILAILGAFTDGFEINSPSKLFKREVGAYIGEGLVDGIYEKVENSEGKINDTIDKIKKPFNDIISKAKTWGSDMIGNFVSGITETKDKLGEDANGIAETISSYLHFSLPEKGPLASSDEWMPDFMKNLADGIENNRGLVQNAISNLTDDMKVKPEIVTAKGNKGTTENYTISFNIKNVNGATRQDAENFAEVAADMLYRRVKRQKAAVI